MSARVRIRRVCGLWFRLTQSSRSPQSFLTIAFATGRFGVLEIGRGFSRTFEFSIRPLRVVATCREMCLRRSRQVTRGRRPSPVGAARGRATKPSDCEAEWENGCLKFHCRTRTPNSNSTQTFCVFRGISWLKYAIILALYRGIC